MTSKRCILIGFGAAIGARALLGRALLMRFRRDVARLNAGDYSATLDGYADDAVLRFNDGEHRWAGEHRGKAAIELFLRDFTAAGLRGELKEIWMGGPPWALTLVGRFDDEAVGADGEQLYRNRVVLVIRTRWGKIVEHEDFYEDTSRIVALEQALRERGIESVAAASA